VLLKPRRLNTTIAALFMVGSMGFAVGSVPSYASAVGTVADAVTFFVASIFFTAASFGQLVQSQSPAMAATGTARDDERQTVHWRAWLPHDKAWLSAATQFPGTLFFNATTFWAMFQGLTAEQYDRVVWRPDFYGSVLFLVSSAYAVVALGRFLSWRPRSAAWRIAWLNMTGSIAFMASALAAFVLPRTGAALSPAWANAGTFAGAVCFLVGAWLTIPAFRSSPRTRHTRPRIGNLC
jgi:hypothetical protein